LYLQGSYYNSPHLAVLTLRCSQLAMHVLVSYNRQRIQFTFALTRLSVDWGLEAVVSGFDRFSYCIHIIIP
jgi:hypothetical protein